MVKQPNATKNLVLQIKSSLPTYSRAFKQLASYVLEQPFAVSSMSTEELAQISGVSIATVNRFARQCGYEGYPQFKAALRRLFDHIFEPIEKAQTSIENDQDIISQSVENMVKNLHYTQTMLTERKLTNAVEMMLASENIFVAGMGVSTLHASFLVDSIEPFLTKNHIKELTTFCGAERAFRQAANFNEKDLLITISLPRYSQSIIDLALLANQKGSKILSLTDQLSSPLVPLSDETLLAGASHPILYASNAPMVALIEILTMAVTQHIDNFAECIEKQTQTALSYFYLPAQKK